MRSSLLNENTSFPPQFVLCLTVLGGHPPISGEMAKNTLGFPGSRACEGANYATQGPTSANGPEIGSLQTGSEGANWMQ